MTDKVKRDSPLVKSVLALDSFLTELDRIGARINATEMTSDFDIEYIQKLMTLFAECGQSVSEEVTNLSTQLKEAQSRAESVAKGVSSQADLLNKRRNEENEKLETFRILGEKVGDLNAVIGRFRREHGDDLTDADRAELTSNIPGFERQLVVLIDELQNLRMSARNSRMKALDKNAESLLQALQAVRRRLRDLNPLTTDSDAGPN